MIVEHTLWVLTVVGATLIVALPAEVIPFLVWLVRDLIVAIAGLFEPT